MTGLSPREADGSFPVPVREKIIEIRKREPLFGVKRISEQLAALHRVQARQFGFMQDNTLGDTLQRNGWASSWVTFWSEHRLGYQLDLAARNGYDSSLQTLGEHLLEKLPESSDEAESLLQVQDDPQRLAEFFHQLAREAPTLLAYEQALLTFVDKHYHDE